MRCGSIAPSAPAAIIGHWTFNEGGGGTAKDTSGQGNDGALNGGFGYVSSTGLFGISLDGQNGIRADWTRRDFGDDGDADVWSLNFVRKF